MCCLVFLSRLSSFVKFKLRPYPAVSALPDRRRCNLPPTRAAAQTQKQKKIVTSVQRDGGRDGDWQAVGRHVEERGVGDVVLGVRAAEAHGSRRTRDRGGARCNTTTMLPVERGNMREQAIMTTKMQHNLNKYRGD